MIDPVSDALTTSIRPGPKGHDRDDQLGGVPECGVEKTSPPCADVLGQSRSVARPM